MEIIKIIFLLISFVKTEDILYNHTSNENNLFFVFTTYRHGARYPFSKVDYFGNNIPHPEALTRYGGLQHLEIGQNYRKRYSNFLNLDFDKNEMYIRSSNVERTIISTEKELEGLFNKAISRRYFHIIPGGLNFWNLYNFNDEEKKEMEKYKSSCKKRILDTDYNKIFDNDIYPILKDFYNMNRPSNLGSFCDSVFTAFFEYKYGNDTNNRIGLCGEENATKIHDFCFNWANTHRGWDEFGAYMFYKLYQHIFEYMDNFINGKSTIKMIMVGGHDITVDKFMNFLDGLKIIPRTHYPHYACNIVIELRKYEDDFYLEFYYNDILKYNDTLDNFKSILDNSKYSNLFNYCGFPPWYNQTNQTNQNNNANLNETHTNITNLQNETNKIEENKTQEIILNQTENKQIENNNKSEVSQNKTELSLNKTDLIEIINETNETKDIEAEKDIIKQNDTQQMNYNNTDKVNIADINKTKINETNNKNETNNELIQQSNTNVTSEENAINNNTIGTLVNLKNKLKKFFKQEKDSNLYLILGGILLGITLIIIIVIVIILAWRRKKLFSNLIEEKTKTINNNLSVNSEKTV